MSGYARRLVLMMVTAIPLVGVGCGRVPLPSVADRDAPQVTEILTGSDDFAQATKTTIANRPGCTSMARFQYAEFAVSMTTGETQREVLDRLATLAGQLSAEVPELATDLQAKVDLARALADGQLTPEREQRAAQAQDRLSRWFTVTCLSAGATGGTIR